MQHNRYWLAGCFVAFAYYVIIGGHLVVTVEGQLTVLSPKSLQNKLLKTYNHQGNTTATSSSHDDNDISFLNTSPYYIPGATPTFGSPAYGQVILGELFYVPTKLCSLEDITYDQIVHPIHLNQTIENPLNITSSTTTTTTTTTSSSTEIARGGGTTVASSTIFHIRRLAASILPHGFWSTSSSSSSSSEVFRSPHSSSATERRALSSTTSVIFLTRRGGCKFVTKARHAQFLRADALIVADSPSSNWTRADIPHVILSDQGTGADVSIPTFLVTNTDGELLIDAALKARSHAKQRVYGELQWSMPRRGVVDVDFWMDLGRGEPGRKFLRDFIQLGEAFSSHLRISIHFFIFQLPSSGETTSCLDRSNLYCADPPPPTAVLLPPNEVSATPQTTTTTTGRDVVKTCLRLLCLLHTTSKPDATLPGSLHSPTFWTFLKQWIDGCKPFDKACSDKILRQLSNTEVQIKVRKCEQGQVGLKLLDDEKKNRAWSTLALRINDVRFSGRLEVAGVTSAICAGFADPIPNACHSLAAKFEKEKLAKLTKEILEGGELTSPSPEISSSPSTSKVTSSASEAPSPFTSSIAVLLFFALVIASLCMYIYQNVLRTSVRNEVRADVMREIQSQLQDYQAIPDQGGGREDGEMRRYKQIRPLIY